MDTKELLLAVREKVMQLHAITRDEINLKHEILAILSEVMDRMGNEDKGGSHDRSYCCR